jgi:hypothetical protein
MNVFEGQRTVSPRTSAYSSAASTVVKSWSSSREQRLEPVAKGRPKNGMVEANGEAWKLVAKAQGLQMMVFGFPR